MRVPMILAALWGSLLIHGVASAMAWSEPICPVKINGFNKFQRPITVPMVSPLKHIHQRLKADPKVYDVIFFGDSMVERWDTGAFSEYFANASVGRFGISGDRVENFFWRLAEGELNRQNPKIILVWGGANNAGTNTDLEIATGMSHVIDQLVALFPKAKVLMMELFPGGEEPMTGWRRQLACVNAKLRELSPQAKLLSLGNHVLDAGGRFRRDMTVDFLHLNAAGYRAISPIILQEIQSVGHTTGK